MCKLFKIFFILFLLICSEAFAADSNYMLYDSNTDSTSSKKIERKSVHNIETKEVNILELDSMLTEGTHEDDEIKSSLPKEAINKYDGIIYSESSFYISNIDPHAGEKNVVMNYPGYRGFNELVVYSPAFGMKTGTNEFGAEATVIGNTVVKFGGADSIIPKDGFVISGHGRAKTWIQKSIVLGSKIYVDEKNARIYSFITPDTYVYETEQKIAETEKVIQYYKLMQANYDSRKANNYLYRAKDYLKRADRHQDRAKSYIEQAKMYVRMALENAIPYKSDEFKGIWIRPVELNQYEIAKTVERIKETGIKNVFLETYYHGVTIYPSEVLSKYGLNYQRSEFMGFDPLKVWITECHRQGLKLHIWFETFYIGNKAPRSSQKHILSVYPEWSNRTKLTADSSEIPCSNAEWQGYFLDPANPQVQQFLQEIINEIIVKYKPDGINLDYIRYPLGAQNRSDSAKGTEWGYTKYARNEFQELYGVDPVNLKVADPIRKKWFEYRQDKVTDFVSAVRQMTAKSNVYFTTVVFTDRYRSLETKMQDWKTWSRKNLVDAFTPMILTTDRNTANNIIREMKTQMASYTKLYTGLYVMYMDAPVDELLMQIHEMRKMKTQGVIFFDYAHLADKYKESLSVRAFNSERN
jgi:uncharacterized lipoprotein YddW (UPF0748 family)